MFKYFGLETDTASTRQQSFRSGLTTACRDLSVCIYRKGINIGSPQFYFNARDAGDDHYY
jgi:hypothetical protein